MRLLFGIIFSALSIQFVGAQLYTPAGTVTSVSNGSNNIGIGTATPDFKLHIKDGNGGAQLKFQRGTGIATITQLDNLNDLFIDAPAGLMLNYGGGNVGIGTMPSQYRLHIKDGDGGAQLKFQRGNGIATIAQDIDLNDLYIEAPAGLMLNYGGGNVGIGTIPSQYKLHIKDGDGGAQLKFQRGTGIATIMQDTDQNDLYIEAPAGLMLNYGGGNVGIGTIPSQYKLHIKDGVGGAQIKFQRGTGIAAISQDNNLNDLYIDAPAGLLLNYSGGNVGVGTAHPDKKLTVKGTIHAEEVLVDLSVPGPDYVFEKDYNLLSLSELEAYIKQNKHLPEVPSAREMEAEGLNLKEMNLILLKKVEELTLHLIEMKKENEIVKKEIVQLKKKK